MGMKSAVVDDPEGGGVREDPPAVEDGKPEVVVAGEAVCEPLAD